MTEETVPDREIIRKGFDEAPVLYANAVDILQSLYDFQLVLGLIEEANDERLVARVVARVVVSPQHAKALAVVLTKNVEKYEEMFGHIPDAPGVRPSSEP